MSINGGTFNLYGGTITGFVNGVEIGSHNDIKTGSSFTMYGGTITSNEAGSSAGGGVFLISTTNSNVTAPSFTMHGGTISNNTAGASDGGGGGVYVGEKCSFTMDGGTITGNTATAGNGGGIYIHYNAGIVSISNATITDNKASATGDTRYGHGGGIYSGRSVTVEDVTITGNNSTYEGGGIYGKGAITLTDATVTDNSQYDVYYDGKETTTPELTVSGSVKAGYYANFDWKLPILVSGELSENSVIHVGVREGIEHGAIAEPASGVTLRAENFKADAADCVTNLGEDGKVYLVPCTHEMDDTGYTCKKCHTTFDARVGDSAYYQTLTKAFDAARGSTVTLLRDVTLAGNCSSSYIYSPTLDLNGKTVSSERFYIHVGGGNKPGTLTVKDSGTGGGTQALDVTFYVSSNGTLAVGDSYTGEISRVELQAGGALERFGGKIGELVLSNATSGSTSTGYGLKLWKGNTNACTIGKFTDNNKSKSLTVKDLLGTDYAKCELYGEKDGTWSIVDKSTKIAELTGYTAYKVQFPECVHQCADDSNPVCSVCNKNLYTKITAQSTTDGSTKTAYFTEDSALENGYVEAIQTLNGWSNEGCTEPTLTLLRDMYAFGTSMPLTGTLTLEGGTHTAKNVTVAENANVTFASGSYRGATINGTATVEAGVTFTDAGVTVNGTLNAKGGTFDGPVEFNGSSTANISGGSFNNEKKYGGVTFDYNVTGTITGGTFTFADFYTTKVKLSGGTFTMIKTNGDRKLADLLAEGAAYYGASDNQAVTNDSVNTLENVKVVSHTHNGGTDGKGICSVCKKQMAASLTIGDKTSWYTAFATAIEAANAADGAKTITLYQNVDDTVYGKRTTYELTRGPVTLATGGKRVDGVDLIAKGISLTVTGSNGSFYVTVDGKDAELTVNDKETKLAIVTAKNGGKLSLSNGTFSRVAVKDDGSSASLSGGSYGEITSDAGYVKPYALLAKGYAYKKTKDNQWLPNANSIPSEVTVEKAPFAVEKIYPNSDTNYTGNSAFATDGSITLTAVIAPETQGVTYYYWWERFDESSKDWTTKLNDVNTATHTGGQNKTLSISNLPENSSYQYHVYVSSDNGYNCYSEPFTVTRHQHSWTYTASGAAITATCSQCSANGGSVTIAAPDKSTLTYDGKGKQATLEGSFTTGVTPAISYTQTKPTQQTLENGTLPTNAGTYTASITMDSATASVTYTIGKATPKAEDFTFSAPDKLTYDGSDKVAKVTPKTGVTDMGDVTVKYYDKDGKEAKPKNAGEYTVKIDVAESTNYAAAQLTADAWKFTITKAAAPTNIPTGTLNVINGTYQTYTYDFSKLLPELSEGEYGTISYDNQADISLVSQSGYYYDETIVEFKNGVLILAQFYAKDGNMTGQIGTVKVKVTTTNYENFQLTLVLNAVNKITPVGTPTLSRTELTYGEPLSAITLSGKMEDPTTGAAVEGTFTWQNPDTVLDASDLGSDAEWKFTPTDKAAYTETTGTATVKVNKARQSGKVSMAGYTYGQAPSTPTLTDRTGDPYAQVTYRYSAAGSGSVQTWDIQNPPALNAGTYRMFARIGATSNYNECNAEYCEFVVAKATPTYTAPTGLTAKYGQTLEDVTLPDGWSWMDSKESVGDASAAAKPFKAKFTPMDTANYNTVENIELEVTVNQADGCSLGTVELTQKYMDASEHTYTPDWAGLPAGQDWTFSSTYSVSSGSAATLTRQDVAAADGNLLTYAISGGKAGDKITITLKASCNNYEDFTITLTITLTAKDDQAALTLTGGETVVYGQTLQLGTSGGNGNGAVTYAVTNGTGEATIDATGKLTPVKVGKVKVSATKAGDASYNSITSAEVEITITRATPTGAPKYTAITTSGKTLADAGLTTAGSTLNPNAGTLVWVDNAGNVLPATTTVEANTTYKWLFTPTDTNYTTLTGSIQLWHKSASSGGGSYYAPVVPDMPMLYRGCTGDAVKTLQEKLNAKGFDSGNVDGIFGAKTYAAVTAFQKTNSLGVDGIVGKLTWAKLYDATPVNVTPVTTQPMLRTGSRGDAVRKLQELLNAKGYTCGNVDGIFGSKTYAAVLAFQKANGLAADGIVGPLTWGKLV